MNVARGNFVAVGTLSTVLLLGCTASEPQGAAVATWQLVEPRSVTSLSQDLHVSVTRLGCASGKTGSVLAPQMRFESDRILIRTDVAALEGAHECPSNDAVALTLNLGQPIGYRQLVDAACLETEASSTTFCLDNGIRWSP